MPTDSTTEESGIAIFGFCMQTADGVIRLHDIN